jgi:hypothetical protein
VGVNDAPELPVWEAVSCPDNSASSQSGDASNGGGKAPWERLYNFKLRLDLIFGGEYLIIYV